MNTTKSEGSSAICGPGPHRKKWGGGQLDPVAPRPMVRSNDLQIRAPETAASGSLGVEVHCSVLAKPRHLANKNDNIYENFNVDTDD